jgi:hypothetical protein
MIRKLLPIALALTLASPALAQTAAPTPKITYIQAGALLDQPGKSPRANSTIIVRDGRIVEIRDGFVAPEAGADFGRPAPVVRAARPDRHARPPLHRRQSRPRPDQRDRRG